MDPLPSLTGSRRVAVAVGMPQFLFQLGLLTFGVFLLSQAGAWFVRTSPGIVSPVWPECGLGIAAALLYGLERSLPAVYLGSMVSGVLSGDPLVTAYVGPLGAVLNVVAGWLLLTKVIPVGTDLDGVWEFVRFVLGGCTVGPALAALATNLLRGFEGRLATSQLATGFLESLQAHAFGVLVFGPFFLFALQRQDFRPATPRGRYILLACSVALCGILIFLIGWDPSQETTIFLLGATLALALGVSFFFGMRPACLFLAMFVFLVPAAVVMFPEKAHSFHIFEQGEDRQLVINGLAFFTSLGCLLVAAFRDELAAANIRFSLALESADLCMWEWSPAGWYCRTASWRTKLGLGNDRPIPDHAWREFVHPHDRDAFETSFDELRETGAGRWSHVYRIRDAKDRWIWVHSHACPVRRDADDVLVSVAGVTRDITQERATMQTKIHSIETEAELKSLRSQLNPHFLFNALNSVRALIGRQDAKARDMIVSLSNLLRELLSNRDGRLQTVSREMEMVRDYLGIEAIRFGERLKQEIRCESGLGGQLIPSMIILTLVENAVKHGISKIESGGTIEVDIRRSAEPGLMELAVMNDGSLGPESGGFGLVNTRRRLALIAGESGRLVVRQIPGPRVEAIAILPLDERRAVSDPFQTTPTTP